MLLDVGDRVSLSHGGGDSGSSSILSAYTLTILERASSAAPLPEPAAPAETEPAAPAA